MPLRGPNAPKKAQLKWPAKAQQGSKRMQKAKTLRCIVPKGIKVHLTMSRRTSKRDKKAQKGKWQTWKIYFKKLWDQQALILIWRPKIQSSWCHIKMVKKSKQNISSGISKIVVSRKNIEESKQTHLYISDLNRREWWMEIHIKINFTEKKWLRKAAVDFPKVEKIKTRYTFGKNKWDGWPKMSED